MKKLLHLSIFLFSVALSAQLTHYDWPTGTAEALLSDKYRVFVKHGTDPEQEVEVLMSLPDPNDIQYDSQGSELAGRSFSFASISYNNIASPGVTFRIVKTYGGSSTKVKIAPKSYNITPTVGTNEVSFTINSNSKYISVNFEDTANETSTKKWIKHMLTIFIDPAETGAPNPSDPGVVTYSSSLSPTSLDNATTIYFPPGYHNLRNYQFGSTILSTDGILTLKSGIKMYLAGGAVVEGIVQRANYNDTNQKIYGRGILTGRQYIWQDANGNKPYGELVELGQNATIDGVMLMDSPNHGIVGVNNFMINNLKILGWHANNDAIRVGQRSEIKNSFIRAVDDFFYNFNNYVHDCVLWAGHNGAVLTYGWGGDTGGITYNSGASTLDNIDIINPEWTGLGNNNGIVAAQIGLDYKPFAYGTASTLTTVKNIRVEGSIPGILNLKPRSSPNAIQVPEANLGYLGDLLLDNITVEKQFAKGLIRGQANATTTGTNTFFTKNVTITNSTIGGTQINTVSAPIFFDVEGSTTQNIVFDLGNASSNSKLQIVDFSTPINLIKLPTNVPQTTNKGITNADIANIAPGTGQWFAGDNNISTGEFDVQATGGNPTHYLSRVSSSEFARGVAYVFNNKNHDAFGILNMSFEYLWKSPLTSDRISYKVYGINDDENNGIDGYFRLSGGSGAIGDNDATNYLNGTDFTAIAGNNAIGTTDTWRKIEYTIDATQYEYIVIVFAGAFGTAQTNPIGLLGIDNVSIPEKTTLSNQKFALNTKSIYPNPTENILNITNIEGDYAYSIFDLSGKTLKIAEKQNSKSINVADLKRGTYILEIKEDNNSKNKFKFIKK
jgi:hypothetical protein